MKALSLDIGAGSGRLVAIDYDGERFIQVETYRFPNGITSAPDGRFVWDFKNLLNHVVQGIEISKKKFPQIVTMGIDTWAVDYARLDSSECLADSIDAYRSPRCISAQQKFLSEHSYEEIYLETGIQNLPFNTIFQLYNDATNGLKINQVLLVPDAIAFYLTNVKQTEITNLSTTALYNPITEEISTHLMEMIGYKKSIFPPIAYPGDFIGLVKPSFNFKGKNLSIVTVCSHDTASAVASCALDPNTAYLSLGTWALLGVENKEPIITKEAMKHNFTNELGVNNTVRFLKNKTGLFIIQELVKDYNLKGENKITYQDIEDRIQKLSSKNDFYINIEDSTLQTPGSMLKKLQTYAEKTRQTLPDSLEEIVKSIYISMAICYRKELDNLQKVIGRSINKIMVIGGGTKSISLLTILANVMKVEIIKGQEEATAIGNALVQLIYQGVFKDINEARNALKRTTPEIIYKSRNLYDNKIYQIYEERIQKVK